MVSACRAATAVAALSMASAAAGFANTRAWRPTATRRSAAASPATMKVDVEFTDDTAPRWYVLNCATGQEVFCKKMLEVRVTKFGRTEIEKIVVPTKTTSVTRGTKIGTKERTLYPSYVFIYMMLTQDSWDMAVHSDYVINFVGSDAGGPKSTRGAITPVPLTPKEIERFQVREEGCCCCY